MLCFVRAACGFMITPLAVVAEHAPLLKGLELSDAQELGWWPQVRQASLNRAEVPVLHPVQPAWEAWHWGPLDPLPPTLMLRLSFVGLRLGMREGPARHHPREDLSWEDLWFLRPE